jgi:hypothetical protein
MSKSIWLYSWCLCNVDLEEKKHSLGNCVLTRAECMSDIFSQSSGVALTYFIILKDKTSAYNIMPFAGHSYRTFTSNINLNLLENFAIRPLGLHIMQFAQTPMVSVSISSFCYQ